MQLSSRSSPLILHAASEKVQIFYIISSKDMVSSYRNVGICCKADSLLNEAKELSILIHLGSVKNVLLDSHCAQRSLGISHNYCFTLNN